MPRSIDVVLRGDNVEKAKPGDRTNFTGTLVVVPDIIQLLKTGERQQMANNDTSKMQRNDGRNMDGMSGLERTGVRDLTYRMVFISDFVHGVDSRFGSRNVNQNDEDEQVIEDLTREEQQLFINTKDQDDVYTKLAESISPSVHGHLDVKKGVMLQLFGGVPKKTRDMINLRGDINICIVGDPATAKSQFLKYIC